MKPHTALSKRANRALMIKLVAAAASYGFSILLARTMALSDFGLVAFFLNAALILSVLGGRGQQIAALRFVPPPGDGAALGTPAGFAAHAFATAARGTLLVFTAAIGIGFMAKASGFMGNISHLQIALGLCLIPLVGWVDLQSHMARGYHLLQLSLIPKEILWRALAGTLVAALYLTQGQAQLSPTSVLGILALVLVLVGLMQGAILIRKTGILSHPPGPRAPIPPQWRTTTNPFWITSVSNIFLANADVVLVGLFAGPGAGGVYFAANRLAMLLAFPLTSYNVVLGPVLAQAWHKNSHQRVHGAIHNTTLKTTLATALMGVFLWGLAPQFLGLFGGDFAQATPVLRILILAGVINAATGPADIALNMCGFQRQAMVASAASLGFSLLALSIGAFLGGATGVAAGVLAGTIIRKGLYWGLALRLMSLRTDIFAALPRRQAPVAVPKH